MKDEHMTSLSGKRLVSKAHGRIAFRGLIDTLEAEVIEAQVLASEKGEAAICGKLGEVLAFLRAVMAAEVKETPLPQPFLFGMDADEIHRQSHRTLSSCKEGNSPSLPAYTQGALAARINTLRAKVREAELLAVRIFGPGETGTSDLVPRGTEERKDIILALNRLSSALWWLYCEHVSRVSRQY